MNEQKWTPKIGDHVYHVSEFHLTDYELRKKNLEGFKNWGLEVVESVITEPYIWKSRKGSALTGWASEVFKREVGAVTEGNRKFYWKDVDFGRDVFQTSQEAMRQAEARTKMAESALHETRYERRPMYKNWMHWKVLKAERKNTNHETVRNVTRRNQACRRKAVLPEELYIKWRDGEITAVAGAEELGVSEMTFASYVKEMLKERGETHKQKKNIKPLSERFKRAYKRWKNGEISTYAAVQESGLGYSTFRYQAKKCEMMEEEYESKKTKENI